MSQDYPPPPGQGGSPYPQRVRVQEPGGAALVTYTLLGINVVVFLLQLGSEYLLGADYPAYLGLKVNELILDGQLWRLFTPMFLHGSFLHIILNMYALLAFGPTLERYYGHGRYILLYLVSGFAGNVLSFMFSLAPSLGSSTAIFWLLGAEAVFLYRNRELFGSSARRALTNLITIAVINLVIGTTGGIDNWGHVGGLIGGTLFAWFGGPLLEVQGGYPDLRLEDQRSSFQALLAGLGVFVLFSLLAFTEFVF